MSSGAVTARRTAPCCCTTSTQEMPVPRSVPTRSSSSWVLAFSAPMTALTEWNPGARTALLQKPDSSQICMRMLASSSPAGFCRAGSEDRVRSDHGAGTRTLGDVRQSQSRGGCRRTVLRAGGRSGYLAGCHRLVGSGRQHRHLQLGPEWRRSLWRCRGAVSFAQLVSARVTCSAGSDSRSPPAMHSR